MYETDEPEVVTRERTTTSSYFRATYLVRFPEILFVSSVLRRRSEMSQIEFESRVDQAKKIDDGLYYIRAVGDDFLDYCSYIKKKYHPIPPMESPILVMNGTRENWFPRSFRV